MVELLEKYEGYVELVKEVSENMSDGFISMAQTRRHSALPSADDLREDIVPNFTLLYNEDNYPLLERDTGLGDAILMYSGLPPQPLKKAQASFIKVVKRIVEIQSLVLDINKIVENAECK
ncbi:hypothetical protein EON63_21615 [archaeon]|nr:MAG: hypothetical protein EON63_21615 [archaeon]